MAPRGKWWNWKHAIKAAFNWPSKKVKMIGVFFWKRLKYRVHRILVNVFRLFHFDLFVEGFASTRTLSPVFRKRHHSSFRFYASNKKDRRLTLLTKYVFRMVLVQFHRTLLLTTQPASFNFYSRQKNEENQSLQIMREIRSCLIISWFCSKIESNMSRLEPSKCARDRIYKSMTRIKYQL